MVNDDHAMLYMHMQCNTIENQNNITNILTAAAAAAAGTQQ